MADATSLTSPSHGLSATLFPNKYVESYRTKKVKDNTQCTESLANNKCGDQTA